MATFKLTLEYDGSQFSGWQRQKQGRTVEGVFCDVLSKLDGSLVTMTSAGRTDTGVHAHGQVVGCNLARDWTAPRLLAALNGNLPNDVVVTDAAAVQAGFHARFDARSRTYRYLLYPRAQRVAIARDYVWQISGPVDVAALKSAAGLLVGKHDFSQYGRALYEGGSTVRTVTNIEVFETSLLPSPADPDQRKVIAIEITANAFMTGMMRALVGAMVSHALGKLTLEALSAALQGTPANIPLAPACGLHQWRVDYREEAA
jgi:tRNA pseudouridine38-40 synthase